MLLSQMAMEKEVVFWGNDIVSKFAIFFTIGLFSSGALTCRKIHNSKSVGAVPHLPFVAASINCSMWLNYGVVKSDSTITLVNVVGLSLQLIYIVIYHTYSDDKYFIRRDFAVALTVVTSLVIYYNYFVSDYHTIVTQLGIICNFFTICFFASPLSTLADVIRSQSVASMSLLFSVMSMFTTLSWTIYGFLITDIYVQFPNFIGFLLSIVQLSMFCLYGNKEKKITTPLPT